jgi:molybdopterin-synthase adenylyltransferase
MKTIVIVGVGALGSQAVMLLRNVKATMKVIDFDRVEAKNVQSQFHGKPGIGKPKVLALAGAMDMLFGVKLQTNSNKLVENNAYELLGAPDLIIDCLDNAASRRVIQTYVRKPFVGRNGIPCLHGAVDANGTFGRVTWDEVFVIDEEDAKGAATCENGEHLPFLSIVAAHLAHAAKEFLSKGTRIGYQVSPGGTIRI